MDLMYSRYSNPYELMNMYIRGGRFGEFVDNIVMMENERKKEAEKKADDDRLWLAYIISGSDKAFNEWRNEIIQNGNKSKKESTTKNMSSEQVKEQTDKAKDILKNFSPK